MRAAAGATRGNETSSTECPLDDVPARTKPRARANPRQIRLTMHEPAIARSAGKSFSREEVMASLVVTEDGAVHDCPILQLDRGRLVAELLQELDELHDGRRAT